MFEREVRRAPYSDEFHFWLTIACLQLGEADQARKPLALALDTSTTRDMRARTSPRAGRQTGIRI